MQYVFSRIKQEFREEIYRIYVTDALKVLGHLDRRYYDMIQPSKVETRTAEEIIDSITNKIVVITNGCI